MHISTQTISAINFTSSEVQLRTQEAPGLPAEPGVGANLPCRAAGRLPALATSADLDGVPKGWNQVLSPFGIPQL